MKHVFIIFFLLTSQLAVASDNFEKDSLDSESNSSNGLIAVFLDCDVCDVHFIQESIPYINYVRDKELAHVHILVSHHGAGVSGTNYVISFIGRKDYSDINHKITLWAPRKNTWDETRKEKVKRIKLGLAPFIANTKLVSSLKVSVDTDVLFERQEIVDPWKNWVFELYGGMNFSKEQTQNAINARYGFYADKVSENWKIRLRPYFNYNERNFITDDETITSKSRRDGFHGYAIRSINQHWSTGFFSDILSSTFHNMDFNTDFGPGIEYSFFPYDEATRRAVKLTYKTGYSYNNYIERTIFDKNVEHLFFHSLSASAHFQQAWGSVRAGLTGSHYFHDFDANRLAFFSQINLRLFSGFAISISGDLDLVNDLVSIPKGEMSLEEILLEQRRQATNYQMFWAVGFTYTFGSDFENVINTRF